MFIVEDITHEKFVMSSTTSQRRKESTKVTSLTINKEL